jgi:hypothetical protein
MPADSGQLYALLIGVDYYFPNRLPGGVSYGHLRGCVRDVDQVESFLRSRLGLADGQIIRLTASHGGANGPAEPPAAWPTYANIVAGFQRLAAKAQAGDQVLIHYSGHGGRARTIYPAHIKSSPVDEALVPTDIGTDAGRYLRDLELAHLLHTLTERELLVTVTLDCCHSGGLTRGEAVARGVDAIDQAERPAETLAAAGTAALLATWQGLTTGTRAGAPLGASGLPASDELVVLAACRPQEQAFEYPFDGRQKSGALTYWLLDTLHAAQPGLTYRHLHQRVLARVQSRFSNQRPQLYGDGSRLIFGRERAAGQFATTVLKVDEPAGQVVLNAGLAHGVHRGAEFAIFPLAADLGDFDRAAAWATVSEEGAADCRAMVDEGLAAVEPGAQAVLVRPAAISLRSQVRLQVAGEGALPPAAQAALRASQAADDFGTFLEWAAEGEAADFIVAARDGFYEIWDAAGIVVPRIKPPLALDEDGAAARLIGRLVHLTRYRNVQQLANSDSRAQGAPQVTLEWLDAAADHIYREGEIARLRIKNHSPHEAEIALLELAPDWQISQVYPDGAADSYTYAPGESDILEFELFVAGDEDEESSFYKLFATLKGTSFRMLELPSLDAPMSRGARMPGNELEELLSQVVETAPKSRAGRLRTAAGREWTTAQVELRVRR